MRRAAGKFRHFGDEDSALVTPVDDNFVPIHRRRPPAYAAGSPTAPDELVRFRVTTRFLNVDPLLHVGPTEDVVTPANSLFKAQMQQKCAKIGQCDPRIRAAAEDPTEQLVVFAHARVATAWLVRVQP